MLRHRSPIPAGLDFSASGRATLQFAAEQEYRDRDTATKARSLRPSTRGSQSPRVPAEISLPAHSLGRSISFLRVEDSGSDSRRRRRLCAFAWGRVQTMDPSAGRSDRARLSREVRPGQRIARRGLLPWASVPEWHPTRARSTTRDRPRRRCPSASQPESFESAIESQLPRLASRMFMCTGV
jgi:hypothetical protein